MGGSMSKERWLAIVGIGEDGIDGLVSCRAAAHRASGASSSAAGAISRWPVVESRDDRLAVADRERLDAIEARRGALGMRARQRRSVLLRRRRDADAPFRRRRNDLRSRRPPPLRLLRRDLAGASRIARCSRCTDARSKRSSRICSRARAFSRCLGTTPRRPSWRRFWPRAAWDDRGSRSARRWGARASDSHDRGARVRARQRRRLEHDRARGRRRARRSRPAARGRAARRMVRA